MYKLYQQNISNEGTCSICTVAIAIIMLVHLNEMQCITFSFSGVSPNGYDSKFHTFNVLGNQLIKVTARSALQTIETTYTITCQEKVTNGFVLSTNHPQDFSSGR